MSSRILVTGAAGFVGSHVAAKLIARGDEVIGLDNFDDYYSPAHKRANIDEIRAGPGGGQFILIEGDIRNSDLISGLLSSKIDAVVHLAGLAGVRASIDRPQAYVDVNVGGTVCLLEAARCAKVKNVVLTSTSSAYGNSVPPFVETAAADRPLAPYAASKRAAELMAHSYHHIHGLSCNVVRLFTVYGPRNRPDMMAYKVLDSIFMGREIPYFGGEMVRDWTYVEDVAQGIVAAVDRPFGYEIFNLGRGHPISLHEFIETIEQLAGRRARLIPMPRVESDAIATGADIEKAQRLLGYTPRVSLREGVERLYQWYSNRIAGGRTTSTHHPHLRIAQNR